MLRKLGPYFSTCARGLVAGASLALAAAASADEERHLGDRFGNAHTPTSERSAEDLDFRIEISSDWLTGGSERRQQRRDPLRYGPYAKDALRGATRDRDDRGLELRFNGLSPAPGDKHRPAFMRNRIAGEDLDRPGISFTINKPF